MYFRYFLEVLYLHIWYSYTDQNDNLAVVPSAYIFIFCINISTLLNLVDLHGLWIVEFGLMCYKLY